MVAGISESAGVVVHAGERPTIQVNGLADRHTVCQIGGAVRGLHAVGVRELVVDLSGMRGCDTRLLTALTRERARFADTGGHLAIVGVQLPEVLTAMRAARLDEVFVIYHAMCTDNRRMVGSTRRGSPRRLPASGRPRPASPARGQGDLRTHFLGSQDPYRSG